jgi:cytochrome c oxidase assembly factor CtaG
MNAHSHLEATTAAGLTFNAVLLLICASYLVLWFMSRKSDDRVSRGACGAFLTGVAAVWIALGSPLSRYHVELLTVHMVQHLLTMTIGPALILLGDPLLVFKRIMPAHIWESLKSSPQGIWLESLGHVLTRPYLCWPGAAAAIIWWHVPTAFASALRFPVVHAVELATFVASGLLFWWPVIEPWPSARLWPRWSILLYLFAATLPCDVLSAFLSFSDRVIYVNYQTTSVHLGMTALEDQQCAGASMWVCVTVIMLLPAAFITMKLLSPGSDRFERGATTRSSAVLDTRPEDSPGQMRLETVSQAGLKQRGII